MFIPRRPVYKTARSLLPSCLIIFCCLFKIATTDKIPTRELLIIGGTTPPFVMVGLHSHQDEGQVEDATSILSSSTNKTQYGTGSGPVTASELPSNWKGRTREDIDAAFSLAKEYIKSDNLQGSEALLKTDLDGYKQLLGLGSHEVDSVVANLATLYFNNDRRDDAIRSIERIFQDHINANGIHDWDTQRYVSDIVNLLSGCARSEEAKTFLAHARELAETCRPSPVHRQSLGEDWSSLCSFCQGRFDCQKEVPFSSRVQDPNCALCRMVAHIIYSAATETEPGVS